MSFDPDNPYRFSSSLSIDRTRPRRQYTENKIEQEQNNNYSLSQREIDHDLDEYPEEERQNE